MNSTNRKYGRQKATLWKLNFRNSRSGRCGDSLQKPSPAISICTFSATDHRAAHRCGMKTSTTLLRDAFDTCLWILHLTNNDNNDLQYYYNNSADRRQDKDRKPDHRDDRRHARP